MDWIALLAAAASILTVLLSFSKLREERARLHAETIRVTAEAEKVRTEYASLAKQGDLDRAIKMIDQLQEDNTRLRAHLTEMDIKYRELQTEGAGLRVGVLILIEQLREMGVEPRWQPPYTQTMVMVNGS